MDIGKRINELMKERKWTKYRLAKECGVYISTVNAWLKNEFKPSVDSLENVCSAFKISMVEFFSGAEETNLTTEQYVVLEKYNALQEDKRKIAMDMLDVLSKNY